MRYYINKEKLEGKAEWLEKLGGHAGVLRILIDCLETDGTATIPTAESYGLPPELQKEICELATSTGIDPVFPKNPEEGD
jgi:hypothetical protein